MTPAKTRYLFMGRTGSADGDHANCAVFSRLLSYYRAAVANAHVSNTIIMYSRRGFTRFSALTGGVRERPGVLLKATAIRPERLGTRADGPSVQTATPLRVRD